MTEKDAGTLGGGLFEGSMENPCTDSSWKVEVGVAADNTPDAGFRKITENKSNRWRIFLFFRDQPEDFFPDDCDPKTFVNPYNYSVHIETANNAYDDSLYFSHPEPADGDGQSDNEELELLLNMVGSFGGPVTTASSLAVNYLMSGSGDSTFVDYERGGAEYMFDIDLTGGYDDLPTGGSDEADVAQVSLRTHNELPPRDDPYRVYFNPEYTFQYADTNQCNCFSASPITKYKTVRPSSPLTARFYSADS